MSKTVAKYQKYAEYKHSGVEWLGEIPNDWEMWKLSHAYTEIGSGTTPSTSNEENFEGNIPWVTTGELRENLILDTKKKVSQRTIEQFPTLKKYPIGSVAIAMYGATIGRLGIFGIEATTNQACCVMTTSKVLNNKYVFYWLQAFKNEIIQLSSGGGQPNINQEKVASLKISASFFEDQINIANFLDHETAKIDTLIAKQEKLIELLKEKRQAVISHAVTKGLNPDVTMKDSGVEWLGKVPEHWLIGRLKNVLSIKNGRDYKSVEVEEGGYPVYGSGGIFKRSSDYLYDGVSILFGRKGTIDKPLLVKGCFWTVDTMFYSELAKNICSEYVYFQSLGFPFDKLSTNTALPSMTQEDLLNLGFAIPPIQEQIEISKFIAEYLEKNHSLMENAKQAIQLMQERRTALISSAVTGKINVTNWQNPQAQIL